MKQASIYFTILVTIGFRRMAHRFLTIFGFSWLLIEPLALFFPSVVQLGWFGYLGLTLVSLLGAVLWSRPPTTISEALSSPDSVIEVKVGDLFDEPDHLVIGTNDVFDTELGDIIKPASVQGQFLTRIYGNDRRKLDRDITAAVESLEVSRTEAARKVRGKRWRYPIGTTIALGPLHSRYFWTIYGHMGNDLKCASDADSIWTSLSTLWKVLRLRGQGRPVAIPIIGSDLARTGLPRMALVKMIAISFIVASKEEFVSRRLTVVVHPEDLHSVNLHDLKEFLKSACF